MDKLGNLGSWLRIILTWVVITPNLFLSYYYLRYPSFNTEIASLGLNFIATTVLFYIYLDIFSANTSSGEEGEGSQTKNDQSTEKNGIWLYKLTFGSLIEDMIVWLGLFFLLYNIVPVTLYVHNFVAKNL